MKTQKFSLIYTQKYLFYQTLYYRFVLCILFPVVSRCNAKKVHGWIRKSLLIKSDNFLCQTTITRHSECTDHSGSSCFIMQISGLEISAKKNKTFPA